jgi:hypothetical protein
MPARVTSGKEAVKKLLATTAENSNRYGKNRKTSNVQKEQELQKSGSNI